MAARILQSVSGATAVRYRNADMQAKARGFIMVPVRVPVEFKREREGKGGGTLMREGRREGEGERERERECERAPSLLPESSQLGRRSLTEPKDHNKKWCAVCHHCKQSEGRGRQVCFISKNQCCVCVPCRVSFSWLLSVPLCL